MERDAVPRPPNKPAPYECCGRHCSPCIMDYYWDALERWEELVRGLGRDPAAERARFEAEGRGVER